MLVGGLFYLRLPRNSADVFTSGAIAFVFVIGEMDAVFKIIWGRSIINEWEWRFFRRVIFVISYVVFYFRLLPGFVFYLVVLITGYIRSRRGNRNYYVGVIVVGERGGWGRAF